MVSGSASVALIQNHIGLDGRSNTLASFVELLNNRNIEPDIFTFSGLDDVERFRSLVDTPIRFQLKHLPKPPLLKGDLLQELAIPYLARSKLHDYELVFTSSTAVYGYPADLNLLRWICFPLERVSAYEERYQQPLYRAYGLINSLLYKLAARGSTYHGRWLANSEFTREVMERTYPLSAKDIGIIYGAVPTDIASTSSERERAVVSIGGFHPDKRQLEQIELARRFPDVRFYIIGGLRSTRYFERCRKAAVDLPNVELLPSAPTSQVKEIFSRARIFLHSKRNEHLGIGTVEAIAHGCLPIVHDSGGQREVVPFDELRFLDVESAGSRIEDVLTGKYDGLLPDLQKHIHRFGAASFRESMTHILDEMLPSSEASVPAAASTKSGATHPRRTN